MIGTAIEPRVVMSAAHVSTCFAIDGLPSMRVSSSLLAAGVASIAGRRDRRAPGHGALHGETRRSDRLPDNLASRLSAGDPRLQSLRGDWRAMRASPARRAVPCIIMLDRFQTCTILPLRERTREDADVN